MLRWCGSVVYQLDIGGEVIGGAGSVGQSFGKTIGRLPGHRVRGTGQNIYEDFRGQPVQRIFPAQLTAENSGGVCEGHLSLRSLAEHPIRRTG